MPILVGNDVVDLTLKENLGKSFDEKYVNRTLHPEEREWLNQSELKLMRDPLFWSLWAAKESAFKLSKKLDPRSRFSPKEFLVNPALKIIRYRDYLFYFDWIVSAQWVHCISSPSRLWHEAVRPAVQEKRSTLYTPLDFTPEERLSIHSTESGQVRQMAKELLLRNGYPDCKIVRRPLIEGFGPPEIWRDGVQLEGGDLSLSHDGNYIAACIVLPRCRYS